MHFFSRCLGSIHNSPGLLVLLFLLIIILTNRVFQKYFPITFLVLFYSFLCSFQKMKTVYDCTLKSIPAVCFNYRDISFPNQSSEYFLRIGQFFLSSCMLLVQIISSKFQVQFCSYTLLKAVIDSSG